VLAEAGDGGERAAEAAADVPVDVPVAAPVVLVVPVVVPIDPATDAAPVVVVLGAVDTCPVTADVVFVPEESCPVAEGALLICAVVPCCSVCVAAVFAWEIVLWLGAAVID
jgi:hypothetical protein